MTELMGKFLSTFAAVWVGWVLGDCIRLLRKYLKARLKEMNDHQH